MKARFSRAALALLFAYQGCTIEANQTDSAGDDAGGLGGGEADGAPERASDSGGDIEDGCSREGPGAGLDSGAGADPDGSLLITVPKADKTYVRAQVRLQFAVNGPAIDRVDVSVDSALLVGLPAPFEYTWDTDQLSEGKHRVLARSIRDERVVAEVSRDFVVDRTPPTFIEQSPAPNTEDLPLDQPFVLRFSEPIDPDTLSAGIEVQREDGTAQAATVSPLDEGSAVEIRLTAPAPELPASVSISLTSGLRDRAGSGLASAEKLSMAFSEWIAFGPSSDVLADYRLMHVHDDELWVLLSKADANGVSTVRLCRWNESKASCDMEVFLTQLSKLTTLQLEFDAQGRPLAYMELEIEGVPSSALLFRNANGDWQEHALPADGPDSPYDIVNFSTDQAKAPVLTRRSRSSGLWSVVRYDGLTWISMAGGATFERGNSFAPVVGTPGGLMLSYGAPDCKLAELHEDSWSDMGTLAVWYSYTHYDYHCLASPYQPPGAGMLAFIGESYANGQYSQIESHRKTYQRVASQWQLPTVVDANAFRGVDDGVHWFTQNGARVRDSEGTVVAKSLPQSGSAVAVLHGKPIAMQTKLKDPTDIFGGYTRKLFRLNGL